MLRCTRVRWGAVFPSGNALHNVLCKGRNNQSNESVLQLNLYVILLFAHKKGYHI